MNPAADRCVDHVPQVEHFDHVRRQQFNLACARTQTAEELTQYLAVHHTAEREQQALTRLQPSVRRLL
ncbi:MAG: hypothetical protein HQ518_21795 [Rhodopirellula sp.]|nr:hypothetical protein [Rhodopirellula sp.]